MKRARKLGLGLLVAVLALSAVEGCSNLGVTLYDALFESDSPIAERLHTEYDAELGWTNVPGKRVEDLYGSGRTVTINAQGFRGVDPTPQARTNDRPRVLCSGDSFTFGYGVGDAEAWPAQLDALRPKIDIANLALGGYGADQAYLHYLRAGIDLEHDLHLFAIIADDINRMTYDAFSGYGKPWLVRVDGQLQTRNVPVPEAGFGAPWFVQNGRLLRRLGVVELGHRMGGGEDAQVLRRVTPVEEAVNLTRTALVDMTARTADRALPQAIVFLPTLADVNPNSTDFLREPLLAALRRDGLPVIDLVAAFRAEPPTDLTTFFLQPGEVSFPGAQGHYTALGNRWVAERLAPVVDHLLAD